MKNGNKSLKRIEKKQRMAKMYKDFFADAKVQKEIEDIHFTWGINMCPRLVRDTVLGSRKALERLDKC